MAAGGSDRAKGPSGESPSKSMVAIEFMLVPSMGQEELELRVLKSCNTGHWNNPGAPLAI